MNIKQFTSVSLFLLVSLSTIGFAENQTMIQQSDAPIWMGNLSEDLQLTPQQKIGMKAIQLQMRGNLLLTNAPLKKIDVQLTELAKHDPLDTKKLDDLISQKQQLLGKLMRNKVLSEHSIHRLLTPSQKVKFEKLMQEKEITS